GLWSCMGFFFQAEDGIRDFHVTGVQTCALPISVPIRWSVLYGLNPMAGVIEVYRWALLGAGDFPAGSLALSVLVGSLVLAGGVQIGRASCRERVEMAVVGVAREVK